MYCVVIGDIHGRDIWKQIVANNPGSHFVFVGDYFDSKENIGVSEQLYNFSQIVALKESDPHQVTLLLGNHDFHYLPEAKRGYSGYQAHAAPLIQSALQEARNRQLLQICMAWYNHLITHAGITCTWFRQHQLDARQPPFAINHLFQTQPSAFDFSPGIERDPTGNEPEQGPLWVRPPSLLADALPGYCHVVGHTQYPQIVQSPKAIFVDVFSYAPCYISIDTQGFVSIHNIGPQ